MSKTGSANGSFLGNFTYDQLLRRRHHFLFDLSQIVDFSFVKAALKDFYMDWGRDPWDPVLMFKCVFLRFRYNLSDWDIVGQCPWNLLFKSFLGLSAEELPPHRSTLCRFRQRLGAEGFQCLFSQAVEQAEPKVWYWLATHYRIHPYDRQCGPISSEKRELRRHDDDHYTDRNSHDPDARFGCKTLNLKRWVTPLRLRSPAFS
jgi:hypothetical protein